MPTTYTGEVDNVDEQEDPEITIPQDGDSRTAASVNTAFMKLADFVDAERKRFKTLSMANAALRYNGTENFVTAVSGDRVLVVFETSAASSGVWRSRDGGKSFTEIALNGGANYDSWLHASSVYNGLYLIAVGRATGAENGASLAYGLPTEDEWTNGTVAALFDGADADGGEGFDVWDNGTLTVASGKDTAGALISSSPSNATPDFTKRYDPNNGASRALRTVRFFNGLWIAVGDNGQIVTSSDGITWTASTSGTTEILRAIAFGAGLYVVGGNNTTVRTSPDGITWTSRTISGGDSIQRIHFGNGVFVAVMASGLISWSADGITWEDAYTVEVFGTDTILKMIFDGHWFVAGNETGRLARSLDGVTWYELTTSLNTTDDITIVQYLPDLGSYCFANNTGEIATGLITL